MSKRRLGGVAAGLGLLATAAVLSGLPSAHADLAPQAHDVVGVGSDIVQNSLNFLADGAPDGESGYNSAGNKYRLFSFDASADANGRNAFTDPALGTPSALNPTTVLRAGLSPVQRPNGGGAGIKALLNDGNGGVSANNIQFVRSPNLPSTSADDQGTAQSNLGTKLHSIQFADDKQYIATAKITNAPAAGLTPAQLASIYCTNAAVRYTTWDQVGGTGTGAIIPERPQDTAGVLKQFQAVLKAGLGGTACAGWNSNVVAVQQNDPTTITGNASPADVIVPFPKGRYALLGSGYFLNPNTAYQIGANGKPTATPLSASGITLQVPGQNGVAAGAYQADLPYYVIFRESDISSPTPWQPGSTLNWVKTLFYNPDYVDAQTTPDIPAPWVESAAAQQLITNLGLTPVYVDKGNATQ